MRKEKIIATLKVAVITGLTLMFAYFFTQVKRGGIMDDALLNHDDPFYAMDQKVKALKSEGLKTGEAINFIIPFKHLDYNDLQKVKSFTDRLKDEFPEYGVVSLATAANYQDTGKELLTDPYINNELLRRLKDNPTLINDWHDKARDDDGICGLLIGRNFDYAIVYLMLPDGYNEIETFHRVTELLENRKISKLEWYFKKDIKPNGEFQDIKLAGWVMARGLMDAALNADILMQSTFGLILTWLLFCANFLNWRQATIASISVLLGLVWTNGSVGLLQAIGFELYERVYFLLVFTAIIVAQISFAARKLDAYNEARKNSPTLSRAEVWKCTGSVNGPILLTAIIAISNFGTLYQIQIRGILEVGIFASLGIVYLLILTFIFLPALHVLIGGEANEGSPGKLSLVWHGFLKFIIHHCYHFCDPDQTSIFKKAGPQKKTLIIITCTFLLAFTLVGADFLPGINLLDQLPGFENNAKFLKITTRPIEYIKGTVIDQTSELLNRPGNTGFDRISFVVQPKHVSSATEPITDQDFLGEVNRFKQEVSTLNGVREVNSALDTIKVITQETHQHSMPRNGQEAHDALMQMEASLDPLVKEQLWYNGGLVLFVSTTADDSNELGATSDQVLNLAVTRFPNLNIMTFGKLNLYPRADDYLKIGKPINVLTSQWIGFLIYGGWIAWSNWRKRKIVTTLQLSWWRTGLVMNVPFFFATSAITIVMVVFRVPLDQATACISALAINAAADFGLYLIYHYKNKLAEGLDHREALKYALLFCGHVIVADVVLNAVCFAPLMKSNFIPVIRLGWIMIVMLLSCGFGALVLMPALLPWAIKRK